MPAAYSQKRHVSSRPIHLILALAAAVWSISAVLVSPTPDSSAYVVIVAHGGRAAWAAVFAADAIVLLACALARNCPRFCARSINAATAGIWATIVGVSVAAYGHVSPQIAAEIALLVGAAWATIRTDRET